MAREQTSGTYMAAPHDCPQPLWNEDPVQADYRNHPTFAITNPNIQKDCSQLNQNKALPKPKGQLDWNTVHFLHPLSEHHEKPSFAPK